MKRFKIILFALFIGAFMIGTSAYSQDDNSKKKKEKKEKKDKSKAAQDIETGWDATKKGTKKGYEETKEFFKGEETKEDKARKAKKESDKADKKAAKKDKK
jgi:hypothetical protein